MAALVLLALGGFQTVLASKDTASAATKTVHVYYLRPSDVPFDQRYPNGIAKVMAEAQRFFKKELGKTFQLDDPVVQVVEGQHPKSYYETNGSPEDPYSRATNNMWAELDARFHPDPATVNVGFVSAQNTEATGGAGPGRVGMPGHDADGSAEVVKDPFGIARFYGGMIHELGHAFGLDHTPNDETTPMSGSGVYAYGPKIHFTQAQKDTILNGTYGSILS